MAELCCIPTCGELITSDRALVHKIGLDGLIRASIERDDGLQHVFEGKRSELPLTIHGKCRRDYIRASNIKAFKKQRTDELASTSDSPAIVLRSMTPTFNIKENCVYCGKKLRDYSVESKIPCHRRERSHDAMTEKSLQSVITKANERGDEWGDTVKLRISNEFDFIAAEVKYHHACQVMFYAAKPCPNEDKMDSQQHAGRPADAQKQMAFAMLCQHILGTDECQYSLSELESLMNDYLDGEEGYSPKWLGQKLVEHFGSEVVVTHDIGKPTIYTFLDESNRILRENYEKGTMTKDSIIDMAAALIRDDIRAQAYESSEYPDMKKLQDSDKLVPDSLKRLLCGIIKTKSEKVEVCERRRLAISHSIISACRPRSFVSPILLAIAVYINRKYESRELVDILSSLSFADDYREVERLYGAFLTNEPLYNLAGDLVNFVFDNADINVRTLTGHGTWHVLGGIACVTPTGEEPVVPVIYRSTKGVDKTVAQAGKFGHVPIKVFKKTNALGLKSVKIGPLEPPKPTPPLLKLSKCLDDIWLVSFSMGIPVSQCPSWSGFMQCAMEGENHQRSKIEILPFVNQDPSHPDTIYSALCFAQNLSEKYGLGICPVTFDQPLYIKAAEIVKSSQPGLKNIVVRLGGFHLLMSYMGAIGYVMGGSGLEDLWETVYAPNTVIHMMTGHAYTRALRAHLLSSVGIMSTLLADPECLSSVDLAHLKTIHKALLNGEYPVLNVENEECVKKLSEIMDDLMLQAASQDRTSTLWVEYLKQVSMIRCFIRAERTGDWDLHLYAVSKMIPLFHAAGHLAYAKSARLYLEQMKDLQSSMSAEQFCNFTEKGFFTIRRKDKFWSGNFSDQTIEQDLMRLLKTSGGVAHGRGITDSTISKWVHAMPRCIPICDALEDFTGVHSHTSDQHVDLRASSTARDRKDYETFMEWLRVHSPFSYREHGSLVNIASGLVASETVNAEQAVEIGTKAALAMTDKTYADVKLKRNDRVHSISADRNKITIRGVEVEVNSTLLFLRVTCVIKESSEMKEYLHHEFAKQPPSLFDKGLLRKNVKSDLASILKSKVNVHLRLPDGAHFVLDGGHLLQSLPWPDDATYDQICDHYVSYVLQHYGMATKIVFDGYGSGSSTKATEQQRRAQQNTSADILFELEMKVTTRKKSFLANGKNKDRLIKKMMGKFEAIGVDVQQSTADADRLIVSTTMDTANTDKVPVVLVGTDTDLLVMLVAQATTDMDIHMLFGRNPMQIYSIREIQAAFMSIKPHLMFAHAITGCDTVSALYNQGKKKAIAVLESGDNWDCLSAFAQCDTSKDEIARVGELFLLKLYGAARSKSLDEHRYFMYLRSIHRSSLISSGFKLESLPPTSSAAKFHSYRVYLAVQQWQGNEMLPTEWGWHYREGLLVPVETDMPVAPEKVLKMISCGCKVGCGKRCSCYKSGMECTLLCTVCNGQNCKNSRVIDLDDTENV